VMAEEGVVDLDEVGKAENGLNMYIPRGKNDVHRKKNCNGRGGVIGGTRGRVKPGTNLIRETKRKNPRKKPRIRHPHKTQKVIWWNRRRSQTDKKV